MFLALRLVGQSNPDTALLHMVWFVAGFVAIALAITLLVLAHLQDSPARRVLGIIADNGTTTYFMLQTGEYGAIVFGLYLFVAFGNGFRYGRLYLRISHATALLGFTIVLFASDFWSQHAVIALGLLIMLLILPMYVGELAQRLMAERLRAEQALKECRDRERGGS